MPKRPVVPNAERIEDVVPDGEHRLAQSETSPPTPDLSGVDLRTLRRTPLDARPELAAAVAHWLRHSAVQQGGWHSGGNDDPHPQPEPAPDQKHHDGPAAGVEGPSGRPGVRRRRPGR